MQLDKLPVERREGIVQLGRQCGDRVPVIITVVI